MREVIGQCWNRRSGIGAAIGEIYLFRLTVLRSLLSIWEGNSTAWRPGGISQSYPLTKIFGAQICRRELAIQV
ncbi:hypothetical protein CGQ11_27635 [Pseudomonas aeruginosa]|nr:hypothetical protein AO970_21880 [Pseudomonas aeruginosa]KSQ46994.1 hypothetical protein APB18_23730 [Pseudomonas aeruginosa]OKS42730.1 hypothetical protein BH609_11445 [Pseudomonas aeruginosa]OZN79113.1 hypothetical protein CGQ14_07580 [Pseudomonas aeruginosa]OZN86334.1 hypothetical protein CGQ13_06835 [Pseudomonas aeruginosa]